MSCLRDQYFENNGGTLLLALLGFLLVLLRLFRLLGFLGLFGFFFLRYFAIFALLGGWVLLSQRICGMYTFCNIISEITISDVQGGFLRSGKHQAAFDLEG